MLNEEMSDWSMVAQLLKEGLRSATTEHGAPCVMITGDKLMLMLYVDSWGSQDQVCDSCVHVNHNICKCTYFVCNCTLT